MEKPQDSNKNEESDYKENTNKVGLQIPDTDDKDTDLDELWNNARETPRVSTNIRTIPYASKFLTQMTNIQT